MYKKSFRKRLFNRCISCRNSLLLAVTFPKSNLLFKRLFDVDIITAAQHVSDIVVRLKHKVNGKPWISTPYRIYVPWNINTKNRWNHYVAYMNRCAKFGNDHSTPFSPRDVWKCQPKFLFSFPTLIYSCAPVGPKRLNRFLRLMVRRKEAPFVW
jgi:hypothetical protein